MGYGEIMTSDRVVCVRALATRSMRLNQPAVLIRATGARVVSGWPTDSNSGSGARRRRSVARARRAARGG